MVIYQSAYMMVPDKINLQRIGSIYLMEDMPAKKYPLIVDKSLEKDTRQLLENLDLRKILL